jgi:hypothetical protein
LHIKGKQLALTSTPTPTMVCLSQFRKAPRGY